MRWFRRSNKRAPETTCKDPVPLKEPVFSGTDRETIRGIVNCSTWNKVRLYAQFKLIDMFLNASIYGMAPVSEDFKAGYLTCLKVLDNLPVTVVEEESQEDDEPYFLGET